MKTEQAVAIYGADYARTYDKRFHLNERSRTPSDHEIEILRQLLAPGGRWLDVACGTGYVLSRFPDVPRAGLDLSPSMLARARRANPDALFMRQGDFRDAFPEWNGRWDLVSCMWYAYGLVESMSEVQQVVQNLASWTADRGACFVPLCDPELLNEGVPIPYRHVEKSHYGGTLLITGVTWSWIEESGMRHENMIAPQVEHMVGMFQEHFASVELVEYPLFERGRQPTRKALIARKGKQP